MNPTVVSAAITRVWIIEILPPPAAMILTLLSVGNQFCLTTKNQLRLRNISATTYWDHTIIFAFRRRFQFPLATFAKHQASNLLGSLAPQLRQRRTLYSITIKLLPTLMPHSQPHTKVQQKQIQLKNACRVTSCSQTTLQKSKKSDNYDEILKICR